MSSPRVPSKRQRLKNFFKNNPLTSSSSKPHGSPSSNSLQQSNVTENLKISGRFALSIIPRIAGCVDENPVKMAFKILNLIMDVRKEINDTKDELQTTLEETLLLLSTVLAKMEAGSNAQSVVNQMVEQYKRDAEHQLERITSLNEHLHSSIFTQVDYQNYKVQLMDISRKIGSATIRFNTAMAGTTGVMVDKLHDDRRGEKLRKHLEPSAMADHRFIHEEKSALKRDTCTDGTRVNILDAITKWANDSSMDSPPVFWLTGQAGSGKTTIAYTITKGFGKEKELPTILGANFFCSRQFGETRSLQRIVPTIAFQLAEKCQSYRTGLLEVDTSDAVHCHTIQEQIEKFLIKPWMEQKLRRDLQTYLVVVDALDEIEHIEKSSFLEQLLKSFEKDNITGLKFLVTSRPDPDIVELCATLPTDTICKLQDVPIEDAKLDITTYLDVKLKHLNGTPELSKLNEQSAGLFIYAATVVKILTRRKLDKDEQLSLLRPLLFSASSDFGSIDQLYRHIMRDAFSDLDNGLLSTRLCVLNTFLCSAERISASVAASLVDTQIGIARMVLDSLYAVLYVQDGKVYWYHASFPDFIFSCARSNFRVDVKDFSFSCDTAAQHSLLAHACFRIMNSKEIGLRFNMGEIKSSYLLDVEHAEELRENVDKNISPVLRYACIHWVHHLSAVSVGHSSSLCEVLSEFIQFRVLFWIEVMNLLRLSADCFYLLQDAGCWATKNGNSPLAKDIEEVANFAAYFCGCPTAASTPHLYISSLATWQSGSLLTRSWKNAFLRIPMYKHTGGIVAVPIMVKRLNDMVSAIAFSPDDKRVVAGMENSAVVLDAATGRQQHFLDIKDCRKVTFSLDGTQLVIVSYRRLCHDYMVSIWDAAMFHLLHEFNAFCATVSIEGTQILTISKVHSDGYHRVQVIDVPTATLLRTVKIAETHLYPAILVFSSVLERVLIGAEESIDLWDISSECALKTLTLEEPSNNVYAISMSPDGKKIVTGVIDHSARVWDASTGNILFVLPHHGVVTALDFLYDGSCIVSGSRDGALCMWDAGTGAKLKVINTNEINISVAVTRDGSRIVSGLTNAVYVWSSNESAAAAESDTPNGRLFNAPLLSYTRVAISDDSRKIMSSTYSQRKVRVWDIKTGTELTATLVPGTMAVPEMSGNGECMLYSRNDGSVKVLNAITGREIFHLENELKIPVQSVALSRSGRKFALVRGTNSEDASWQVEIWNPEPSKEAEFVVGKHTYLLAFSDDERYIVGDCIQEGSPACIIVWDALTGNIAKKIKSEIDAYESLFSSNGREVAVCAQNPTPGTDDTQLCEVWDISSGECLQRFKTSSCWPQNGRVDINFPCINSIALSNNGKKIVALCSDGFIRIWSYHRVSAAGAVEVMLIGCSPTLISVVFFRDDNQVVTGSADGSVQIWDLDPDTEKYEWTRKDTGWITSSRNTEHRFMWVSDPLKVIEPRSTVIISSPGHGSVDFSGAMIGEEWEKCYSARNSVDGDK